MSRVKMILLLAIVVMVSSIAVGAFLMNNRSVVKQPIDRSCDLGARGTDIQHSSDPETRVIDAVNSYHLMNGCYGASSGKAQFLRNLSATYAKEFVFEKDGKNMVMCRAGDITKYRVVEQATSPATGDTTKRTVIQTYQFGDGKAATVEYAIDIENDDAKIISIRCL